MTFGELIDRLRELGVHDDDRISSIELNFGVPGEIMIERYKMEPPMVAIWQEYD